MEFEVGYILSLVVIGISFLGFMLSMMMDEVNKKKGIVMLILSIVLLLLGGYYYYTVGQWQRLKGGPSINKINYYLHIYREQPAIQQQVLPLTPGTPQNP
ncbi:MAG TPA: hypothetical protein P5065_04695 [Candidatus Ratteibacteria bacterium]|jgi:hypothetical protein|uniref:Uncharacterized protein n=1 Tax=candidate division TA06 bacterium ADurb.Bin131 TaxID=1852827 RepID=A0A1V6C689_UNCT6|nr:MAG: hypothetical protein BWX89_01327 [candidate division TA06 bacterium ADurb.Bin131]HOC03141.1 hypothetical protein [bacterium]HRS06322.1 hypothetical protein [Candidatus Ratteibacteria bacterium]HON05713.1 hypothetical protein [bacterium]HOQ82488.1 hypothetical protein [bacterium]